MRASSKEMVKRKNNIIKISLLTGAIILVATLPLIIFYGVTNYGPLKSPPLEESYLCTNREKIASVCKEDIVCQCKGDVYANEFFFANSNKECPPGCGVITPSSSEGNLGTCNLAAIMAADVPSCNSDCTGKDILLKSQNITNECCTLVLERQCMPNYYSERS